MKSALCFLDTNTSADSDFTLHHSWTTPCINIHIHQSLVGRVQRTWKNPHSHERYLQVPPPCLSPTVLFHFLIPELHTDFRDASWQDAQPFYFCNNLPAQIRSQRSVKFVDGKHCCMKALPYCISRQAQNKSVRISSIPNNVSE